MTGNTALAHKRLRVTLFLLAAFAWFSYGGTTASAMHWHECDTYCPAHGCDSECWENQFDFDNDHPTTCLAHGDYDLDQVCCGDGLCQVDAGESNGNCTGDCGQPPHACNNNTVCELGETCVNCPYDCGSCGSAGSCNSNGKCEVGEGHGCSDCQVVGFCTQDSDCDTTSSVFGFTYSCIDDYCMIEEMTGPPCDGEADCEPWEICLWVTAVGAYGVCVSSF
jgi:hypothetical protein